MVDIVGYMTTVNDESGDTKRVIIVDPASDKFVAKDRTGRLGKYIEPDFTKIVDGVRGDKSYSWIQGAKPEVNKDQIASAAHPHVPNSRVQMTGAIIGSSEEDRTSQAKDGK